MGDIRELSRERSGLEYSEHRHGYTSSMLALGEYKLGVGLANLPHTTRACTQSTVHRGVNTDAVGEVHTK